MLGRPNIPHNIYKIFDRKKEQVGVWERKPDTEVREIEKEIKESSHDLIMPFGMLGVSFAACIFIACIIDNFNALLCLLIPIIVGISTYKIQIYKGRSLAGNPRFKICNKCSKEDWIGLKECTCGGVLEPPEFYNFIEKTK